MTKEVTKTVIKEVTRTPATKTPASHKQPKERKAVKKNIEQKLVENLVELQKVHTALAEKFDKLADQISHLLALFEMAARSFASSPSVKASEKDKEFLEKINLLLDQNKTIAKGLTLMEDRIRERVYGVSPNITQQPQEQVRQDKQETNEKEDYIPSTQPSNRPLPRF